MNMVPQLRSLDNSTLANKDMISDLERVERVRAAVESAGWSQDRTFGYVAVSSHVYGDAGRVGCWRAGVGWVCAGAEEVAADHGFGLDYGLAAEDDVLGAVDLGTSGDLVACVLGLVSSVLWIGLCMEGVGGVVRTVSMYSLLVAFGGGILKILRGLIAVESCNCGDENGINSLMLDRCGSMVAVKAV